MTVAEELQIQNEEQIKEAAERIRTIEIELGDPLLDAADISQLQAEMSGLKAAIDEYRGLHPKPEPTPPKSINIQEAAPVQQDPRPDLKEDANLWQDLLLLAHDMDRGAGRINGEVDTLCGVLNGFRCGETRLRPGRFAGAGMWILKPDITPGVLGAWESQAEYDDFKKRYLQPWGEIIPILLQKLTKLHPVSGG